MSQASSELSLLEINAQNQCFAAQELAKHQMHYPNEYVVRFLSSIQTDKIAPKEGLDIGFGSGQHLKLLMEFGFRASGVELVAEARNRVNHLYGANPLFGDIFIGDFRTAGLLKNKFDVIICWGVVFLRPLEEMYTDLKLIFNLLRPGGHICINFRTNENWFYGLGKHLGDEHFLLDKRAGAYAGAHYTFVDEMTVQKLIIEAGFELKNLERWDWWKNNMKEKHSWWIIWGKHPN
jgi:SAM-dependent methyltransferase